MPRENEVIGPYRLIEKLGAGEYGVVWKAEKYQVIAPPCAIKFPTRDDIDMDVLKREAEVWVRASGHPNVLSIIEAGVYDGQLLIVSEYAQSGSLHDWMARYGGKAPTERQATEMMMGILAGLDHLHRQKIVHRDLKPANIMLQEENPRLADFGLARVLHHSSGNSKAGGTLAYMGPEAFRNKRTELTDIWAAGVILYELLCGWSPFTASDLPTFMWKIIHEPPREMPPGVAPGLRRVVEKALEKDPQNRFQSAAEMREALRRVLTREERVPARPVVVPLPRQMPTSPLPRLARVSFSTGTIVDGKLLKREAECDVYSVDLGRGCAIEMVRIPAGKFLMGSPTSEEGRNDTEGPQHVVSIREFFLGKYVVTQRQWELIAALPKVRIDLDTQPSYFRRANRPVEQVSWDDAQEFLSRLNRKLGLEGPTGYRLPSEAEWEYAARAGTTTPFSFGQAILPSVVNYYGNGKPGVFRDKTIPVGALGIANPWGLYDMHGNVWEWCEDDWHPNYHGAPEDGRAWYHPPRSANRVYRGGGWYYVASACRSAYRYYDTADTRFYDLGFRLSRSLT